MVRVDIGRYAGCGYAPVTHYGTDVKKKKESSVAGQTAEKDNVDLSAEKETSCSGSDTDIKEYIRYLETLVPGRKIAIADLNGKEELGKYAMSHQGTFQIVISQKALEKMMSDPEFEKQCMDAMRAGRQTQAEKLAALLGQGKRLLGCGLSLGEDGEVSQWVLAQKQNSENVAVTQKGKDQKEGSFWYKTDQGSFKMEEKKASYVPARDLIKIARAGNRQAVRRTISGIHAQIYQLKSGGGETRVKAVLVKQAEQVLMKAKLKEKQLKKEELLKLQQKRTFEKAEYEKSLQLKQLLKRKREGRKVREYGQIRDYYETPQQREREEERMENSLMGNVAGAYGPVQTDVIPMENTGTAFSASAMGGEIVLDITLS